MTTTNTPERATARAWLCSGCGKEAIGLKKPCDCATGCGYRVEYSSDGTHMEHCVFDVPVEAVNTHDALQAENERLREQVKELREGLSAMVTSKALKGVREIVSGWNGEGKADGPYERHPSKLGATLPKTNCGAVYELDEAMRRARTLLTPQEPNNG